MPSKKEMLELMKEQSHLLNKAFVMIKDEVVTPELLAKQKEQLELAEKKLAEITALQEKDAAFKKEIAGDEIWKDAFESFKGLIENEREQFAENSKHVQTGKPTPKSTPAPKVDPKPAPKVEAKREPKPETKTEVAAPKPEAKTETPATTTSATTADKKAQGDQDGKASEKAAADAGDGVRNWFSNIGNTVKGWFSGGDNKNEPEEKNPDGTPKENGFMKWLKGINIGGIAGGVGGLGLAFFIGNAFGGGIVGTICGLLLAPFLAMLGSNLGDKHLNPLIGRPSSSEKKMLAQGHGVQKQVDGVAQNQTPAVSSTLTNAEIVKIYESTQKELGVTTSIKPAPMPAVPAQQGTPAPLTEKEIYEIYKATQEQVRGAYSAANVNAAPSAPSFTPNVVASPAAAKAI